MVRRGGGEEGVKVVAVCGGGGGGGGGGAPPQVGGRSDPRTPPAKLHSAPPAAELCSACELLECGPTTLGGGELH